MEECWNAIYLLVKSCYAKSLAIQQCVNVCRAGRYIDMFVLVPLINNVIKLFVRCMHVLRCTKVASQQHT